VKNIFDIWSCKFYIHFFILLVLCYKNLVCGQHLAGHLAIKCKYVSASNRLLSVMSKYQSQLGFKLQYEHIWQFSLRYNDSVWNMAIWCKSFVILFEQQFYRGTLLTYLLTYLFKTRQVTVSHSYASIPWFVISERWHRLLMWLLLLLFLAVSYY